MDTLKLGFKLDAYQDGRRWIKEMRPFAKVKDELLFPDHQIDIGPLVDSITIPGEHYIVTCTCGILECGRIYSGILVAHERDAIHWRVIDPEPERLFTFKAAQYRRVICMLIDDLAAIAEEPDGCNEYGYHGFYREEFMEIFQKRQLIGE